MDVKDTSYIQELAQACHYLLVTEIASALQCLSYFQ